MELLSVKNIKKSFDDKVIINDISFTVKSGKIVGLLGKNGSGKTTIIKMINDLLTLDEGEILVNGSKIGVESKNGKEEKNILLFWKSIYSLIYQQYYCYYYRSKW